jgi:hypothetical protein
MRECKGTHKEKLKRVILLIVGDDSTINETTQLCESAEKIDYRTLHLLLFEGVQKYDMISKRYTEFYYDLFDFIKEVIEDGMAQGVIREDIDPTEISLTIETIMVGTVLMWIGMPAMPLGERMDSNINQLWSFMKKED